MPLYRAFLQTLGALVLLAITLACSGKKSSASSTTVVLNGTVTYTRIPLAKSAAGVPLGLVDSSVATNLQTLPARGVAVRVFQRSDQTNPDGSSTPVWGLAQKTTTDASGKYSFQLAKDKPTMVEVISQFDAGSSRQIQLIGDPAGINSSVMAASREVYALRKAADGSAPTGMITPNSTPSSDSTVDFTVGLNDTWWLTNPSISVSSGVATNLTTARLETSVSGRIPPAGSGSRILAIGDTIATFVAAYPGATAAPGTTLALHYWLGRSEPRGSFVEYDPSVYPKSYDPAAGGQFLFGSLRGSVANDDAWDEGVILPILARNSLFAGNQGRTFSVGHNTIFPVAADLTDLSPDLARIEGLADAMAANALKSPYLADTNATGLATPVRDIRNVSGFAPAFMTPYSAPALRALAWEIILKANSLPSPGTASDWANINPLATTRFFLSPGPTGAGGTQDAEPLNIYSQMARLKEAKGSSEPVDLSTVFTTPVLTALAAPFGIAWPRPSSGAFASFIADWGTDPNSLITPIPPFSLNMAKATQVNGLYPNASEGEVFYAGFSLSADKRCILSVSIAPALPAGSRIDLDLPTVNGTFSFTSLGGSTLPMTLPVAVAGPVFYPIRVRLVSPSAVQPTPIVVGLAITPAI